MEMPGIFSFSIRRSSEGLMNLRTISGVTTGTEGKGVGQRYLMKTGKNFSQRMIHGNVKIIYDPMQEFRYKFGILHGVHDQVVNSVQVSCQSPWGGKTWGRCLYRYISYRLHSSGADKENARYLIRGI